MPIIATTSSGIYTKNTVAGLWNGVLTGATLSNDLTQISPIGMWGSIITRRNTDKTPYFVGRGTIDTNKWTASRTGNYTYLELSSSYQTKFGTGLHCACGHQRKALISYENKIFYSDEESGTGQATGFFTGWSANFVNVGRNSDVITGMYNLNGNLYVLMYGSIWAKAGEESDLIAENFREIVSYQGSHPHVNCTGDGNLFFGNANGVYILDGSTAHEITSVVKRYWQNNYDPDTAQLSFQDGQKWLWVSPSSTSDTMYFDMKTKKWFYINQFKPHCMAGSPMGEELFVLLKNTDTHLYTLGRRTVGSDSVTQVIQTPFTSLTHGHNTKRLSRVHIQGTGVTQLDVYTRDSIGAGSLLSTTTSPQEFTVFNNSKFNEISLKISGTGSMILRSVAVEFTEERM